MKIAIDINDVIRGYTKAFVKNYNKCFNTKYKLFPLGDGENLGGDEVLLDNGGEGFETNHMYEILPFDNEESYNEFTYINYVWEIFGNADMVHKQLKSHLNLWLNETLQNIDVDEPIEIMYISTMEYDLSIQSTYFYLSKTGSRIREIYFPKDTTTMWDKFDVLITANPFLIEMGLTMKNKTIIKINQFYNKHIDCEMNYDSMVEFIDDNNIEFLTELINKQNND